MNKTIILTITLVIIFSGIIIPSCHCKEQDCIKLDVHIKGSENYTVHDELVIIRYRKENETSPVLYETRTETGGVAHFCIEKGDYWVDVRNIWIPISLNNDTDLVFPYLLYKDSDYYTGNTKKDENSGIIAIIIGITVFIIVIVLYYVVRKKAEKKRNKKADE